MADLYFRNKEIKNYFELLGNDENAMTRALGWALSKNKTLLKTVIRDLYSKKIQYKTVLIRLQQSEPSKGITDIEILIGDELYLIIEAKKGRMLPTKKQIKTYLHRFRKYKHIPHFILVISEAEGHYAASNLPNSLYGVPIRYRSWKNIFNIAENLETSKAGKHIVLEYVKYMKEVISMQEEKSNRVLVVSLNKKNRKEWGGMSGIDIVKNGYYFYEVEKKPPPTYIAFRYDGELQTIHYIKDWEVVDEFHSHISQIPAKKIKPHYLLKLGQPFEPRKRLPNGTIFTNARFYCAIDTLFTSRTVEEAQKTTKKREIDG